MILKNHVAAKSEILLERLFSIGNLLFSKLQKIQN